MALSQIQDPLSSRKLIPAQWNCALQIPGHHSDWKALLRDGLPLHESGGGLDRLV